MSWTACFKSEAKIRNSIASLDQPRMVIKHITSKQAWIKEDNRCFGFQTTSSGSGPPVDIPHCAEMEAPGGRYPEGAMETAVEWLSEELRLNGGRLYHSSEEELYRLHIL